MNACIFIMAINSLMPVYGPDKVTQVDQVSVGDSVCVTRIENGWTQIHWSSGNVGHTGWLQDLTIKQNAQPTEPAQREEEYNVPPPALAPTPAPQLAQDQQMERHVAPPTQYRGPAPTTDVPVRPTGMFMLCQPPQGKPYGVGYKNGHAATFSASGTTRDYPVIREFDDVGHSVFYVTLQRSDQERAVFVAFDYSRRADDISMLKTQLPGQQKLADKCSMDWELSK